MVSAEHQSAAATPLLSDNDLERAASSSSSSGFEYVDYEGGHSSEADSATLSGSTVKNDSPAPYTDKADDAKDGLPAYTPRESDPETAGYIEKGGRIPTDDPEEDAEDAEENNRFNRCGRRGRGRRCFGGRGGRRCRRASKRFNDEDGNGRKRHVRRRVAFFFKALFLFGLFSFFMTKMCLRHRKHHIVNGGNSIFDGDYPGFTEDLQTSGRNIIIDYDAKNIIGQYPLYDLLSLKTTSGSVNAIVNPQPADPDHPGEPARLVVETVSGSVSIAFVHFGIDTVVTELTDDDFININYSEDSDVTTSESSQVKRGQIPYRPYEIEIKTESGSINGRFFFTYSAHLETESGHISASFVPVVSYRDASSGNNTLVTKTESGAQAISFSEPFIAYPASGEEEFTTDYVTLLSSSSAATSSHISESGSISVEYPHSWAGHVEATSSGSIQLGGYGLEVTEQVQGHSKGVKRPEDNDDEKQRGEWWGSQGDMNVSLESAGAIQFHVANWPHHVEVDA